MFDLAPGAHNHIAYGIHAVIRFLHRHFFSFFNGFLIILVGSKLLHRILLLRGNRHDIEYQCFLYPADSKSHIIFRIPLKHLIVQSGSGGSPDLFCQTFCRWIQKNIKDPVLILFMQLIHELNQIFCIFRRAFLPSGFPSTVIIFSKSRKFLPVGVQAKRFKGCRILLTVVTANVNPVISPVRIRLLSVPI